MSLEDDTRSTLLDDRRELPGWPDAADRVHAGMRRRARRRRLAVTAAGLVALAIAVPVTLGQTNRGPARVPAGPTSVVSVPWGGDAAPVNGRPTPGQDDCTPADLAGEALVDHSSAEGADPSIVVVSLANIGSRRCQLTGAPWLYQRIAGAWQPVPPTDGAPVVVIPSDVSLPADPSSAGIYTPAIIGPHEAALVRLKRSSAACVPAPTPEGIPPTYTDLALGIGAVRLPISGISLAGRCAGVAVSDWFTVGPNQDDHGLKANYRLDGLHAAIIRTGPAHEDRTLDFVVALHNPTRADIPLRPAPYYIMTVGYGWRASAILQLRRGPAVIPAGGTVDYEMRIDLPADLFPLGPNPVVWQLGTIGTDVGASATVNVTDPD